MPRGKRGTNIAKRWWERSPEMISLIGEVAAETGHTPIEVGNFLYLYTKTIMFYVNELRREWPYIIGLDLHYSSRRKATPLDKEKIAAYQKARQAKRKAAIEKLKEKDFSRLFAQSVK